MHDTEAYKEVKYKPIRCPHHVVKKSFVPSAHSPLVFKLKVATDIQISTGLSKTINTILRVLLH